MEKGDIKNPIAVVVLLAIAIIFVKIFWQFDTKNTESNNIIVTESEELDTEVLEIEEPAPTIDVTLVESHLQDVGLLISEKYNFKEVVNYDDQGELGFDPLSLTETKLVASYQGIVSAGVDFTQITITKDDNNQIITVQLPEAEILSVEVDEESMEVYEEKQGFLNTMTADDLNSCIIEVKKTARAEAVERGILTDADENAKRMVEGIVSGMLEGSGYSYKIVSQ